MATDHAELTDELRQAIQSFAEKLEGDETLLHQYLHDPETTARSAGLPLPARMSFEGFQKQSGAPQGDLAAADALSTMDTDATALWIAQVNSLTAVETFWGAPISATFIVSATFVDANG